MGTKAPVRVSLAKQAALYVLEKEAVFQKLPPKLRKSLAAIVAAGALAPSPAKAEQANAKTPASLVPSKKVKPYKPPTLNEILEGQVFKHVDQPLETEESKKKKRRVQWSAGVSKQGIAGLHAKF